MAIIAYEHLFGNSGRRWRAATAILRSRAGQAQCLGCHTLFAQASTTSQGKDSMAVRPPDLPCAKGAVGERRLRDWRSTAAGTCAAGPVSGRPGGAAAPSQATKQNDAICFTIPPAWLARCPPFAQGGAVASRHGGEPPLPNCAAALENRIGLGLHPGPYRVMVYHTRSRKADNA